MKPQFYRKVLKNGMTLILEKRNLPVVSVAFAVRNGGVNEKEEEKGISHFIEHMLYKGTPTRNAKKIADEINAFTAKVTEMLPVKMVVLYGSYAKGTERDDSDIDLAIVVDKLEESWWKVNSRLFLISADMDANIEPNLIVSKDNKNDFLQNILKYGKIIFQAA